MSMNIINEQEYYRTVYGGWLGKNIGGTLGAPLEGRKELLNLSFYPKLTGAPLENDDLDLQLVWLHALEQYGPALTSEQLGQEWLEHIFFPYDEYGYALTNLRNGLLPPVAGSFNNPFADCMGAPIRSEIWAMTAPGAPHIAAYYAYQDAIVDHAGGEGAYGELFFASIQSAIFYEKDRDRLINVGLSFIPEQCRTAKALQDLLRWYAEGKSWTEARSLIIEHHGRDNFTDAPQNIAFTVLGWLYGSDFEDALLKAVNCGYDTDCTAATLGAILGMILGPEGLPEKWVRPVGDRIVVSAEVKGFHAPQDLDELTRRTMRMGKQVLSAHDASILIHPEWPTDWREHDVSAEPARKLWGQSVTSNEYLLPRGSAGHAELKVVIEFGSAGPAIGSHQVKPLQLTITNQVDTAYTGTLALALPDGWRGPDALPVRLAPGTAFRWDVEITAAGLTAASHELALIWTRSHDQTVWSTQKVPFALVTASNWMIWGPDDQMGKSACFAGNKLDWEALIGDDKDGIYRAETMLHVPAERRVSLIAAANCRIKLKLDGKPVIDCKETLEFMPAYHRAPNQQRIELDLPKGDFKVEVEAVRCGRPLDVYVLAVGPRATSEPGFHYYFTDMLFGAMPYMAN